MASAPGTQPEPVKQTWMPMVAGILSIVAGGVQIIAGIVIAAVGALATFWIGGLGGIAGFPVVALGVVAIIGGICSLRRKAWGLALAGAICAVFIPHVTAVVGILAVIFVASSRKEFK